MALASANDALDGVGLKSLKITIGSTKSYKTDSIRFILTTFDHIESRLILIWKHLKALWPCIFILRSFPCSGSERRRMTSRWLGGTRPAVHVQPRGISTYIRVHKRDVQRIMETEIEWNIEIETWLQRRPSKSDTFDCGWISNYKHTFAEDVFPRLLTESLHGCDVGVFDPWIAMRFEFSLCFRIFDLSRQWMLPLQRPQNAKDTVSKVMFKDHENSCTSGTKHKGTQPSRSASLSCCLLWNRSLKDPGTK